MSLTPARQHPSDSLASAFADHLTSKRKYEPQATILRSDSTVPLATTQAAELTYKLPIGSGYIGEPLIRDLVFIHKGACKELQFEIDESAFETLKPGLDSILRSIVLDP